MYEEDFEKHVLNMKSWFLERDSRNMINSQMGKLNLVKG